MALEGIGIPHPGGRRKHKDATQRHAAAITEARVGIPHHLDAPETDEGAPGWRNAAPPPGGRDAKDVGSVEKYRDPGKEDFKHLGELLLYLRVTYFDRISGGDPDRPRSDLKAAAVVDYLRKHNYSMTSGSYSMLEQGKTLPRNPEQFLDIISKCFRIDRFSKYWVLLRRQYVYDHTVRFVGREYADQTVVHGSALLRSLRGEPSGTDPSLPVHQPTR
jgi:hypothetical protein